MKRGIELAVLAKYHPTHLPYDLYTGISYVCPIPREALLDHLVLYVQLVVAGYIHGIQVHLMDRHSVMSSVWI